MDVAACRWSKCIGAVAQDCRKEEDGSRNHGYIQVVRGSIVLKLCMTTIMNGELGGSFSDELVLLLSWLRVPKKVARRSYLARAKTTRKTLFQTIRLSLHIVEWLCVVWLLSRSVP